MATTKKIDKRYVLTELVEVKDGKKRKKKLASFDKYEQACSFAERLVPSSRIQSCSIKDTNPRERVKVVVPPSIDRPLYDIYKEAR